jgi:SAM-dependent methyltransferase
VSLPLSKVCDAADWFDPGFMRIVGQELRELPRFHRKQWEFAMVFQALAARGLLHGSAEGLALGGGRERLLYALAPHVAGLVVTDLYAPDTSWAESRTDDPVRFVREGAPFPVDTSRLHPLRMDMRRLELPAGRFDFAYSCCAIEHIGEDEDFAGHLREVHRVLRPGGVYVFTTEFHHGQGTIQDPQNYVFDAEALQGLLGASPLAPEAECSSGLAPHRANFPLPEEVGRTFAAGALAPLMEALPHVQLLRGGLPHCSAVFVLVKDDAAIRTREVAFPGLEPARRFLSGAVEEYRDWLQRSDLPLVPAAYLPAGTLPSLEPGAVSSSSARMLFHTQYVWLGGGRRRFEVTFRAAFGHGRLEVRLHRQRTLGRGEVATVARSLVPIGGGTVRATLDLDVEPDSSYAALGEFTEGGGPVQGLEVRTTPL